MLLLYLFWSGLLFATGGIRAVRCPLEQLLFGSRVLDAFVAHGQNTNASSHVLVREIMLGFLLGWGLGQFFIALLLL